MDWKPTNVLQAQDFPNKTQFFVLHLHYSNKLTPTPYLPTSHSCCLLFSTLLLVHFVAFPSFLILTSPCVNGCEQNGLLITRILDGTLDLQEEGLSIIGSYACQQYWPDCSKIRFSCSIFRHATYRGTQCNRKIPCVYSYILHIYMYIALYFLNTRSSIKLEQL